MNGNDWYQNIENKNDCHLGFCGQVLRLSANLSIAHRLVCSEIILQVGFGSDNQGRPDQYQ
jgi:hypothetical protein